MGSILSTNPKINNVRFNPLGGSRLRTGCRDVSKIYSEDHSDIFVQDTHGRVFTNGVLGGNICISNYMGEALHALVAFGVITKDERLEHVRQKKAQYAAHAQRDRVNALLRVAKELGITLTKRQIANLVKLGGREA
jgi:hypothetical protein